MKSPFKYWITARARQLAASLTAARVKTGWDHQEFAQRLCWPTGKIEQIESGTWAPSAPDVTLWLSECGVPAPDQPAILELVDGDHHDVWVRPHSHQLPEAAPGVLFQHEIATEIISYNPDALSVLVQDRSVTTEDLLWRFHTTDGKTGYEGVRTAYSHILRHRRHPPDTTVYLHESVLRAVALDEEDRWDLHYDLCVLIEREAAKVRIIPADREAGLRIPGFSLLRFDAQSPLVCRPCETVTLILEGVDHVAAYEPYAARLDEVALSPLESRDLIVEIAGGQEAMAGPPAATVEALARDGEYWEPPYITEAIAAVQAQRDAEAASADPECEPEPTATADTTPAPEPGRG